MKILVAVDGSPHTQRMLAYLESHKDWFGTGGAEFTVVHSVPAVPPGAANMLSKDDLKVYYDGEAEKVFEPVRQFFARLGWSPAYVSKVGPAAENIAHVGKQGSFDLLLMGSHGHGALGQLLLGSVATRVIAQCSTPVLLVR
jgi:nucleotide-binding universal stress UspA family protein